MPIRYTPKQRTILLCDYAKGGFQPPEMVKRRPAVVISPRLPHRDGLCAVVPLSTTAPEHAVPYVVEIELSTPLPDPFSSTVMWAKCDMVATVGLARLDLFRTGRDYEGKRKYLEIRLDVASFEKIIGGVRRGLGI